MITVEKFLKNLLRNPKTTAAGVGAILALCGVVPPGFSEEKVALAIIAAGTLLAADGNNSGSSGPQS